MEPQNHASSENLQTGARVALIGLVINVVLAAGKILAGVLGHAYVLIADGIESALDVGGSMVIWAGLKVAARPPDATHPYGHGKAEPLAAIAVAIGVLAAALGLAALSVHGLFLPHTAPAPFTLSVLIVTVAVKEIWFRYVNRFAHDIDSTAVKSDALHHRTDAIVSAAAFVGITIALVGGTKWRPADDWAALFACTVIAANGARLLRPALREIMDTAPRGTIFEAVEQAACSVDGVEEIEEPRIRKMGLEFYVDLHVAVDGNISVHEGHRIAHQVKRAVQECDKRIADVLVHIEPRENV